MFVCFGLIWQQESRLWMKCPFIGGGDGQFTLTLNWCLAAGVGLKGNLNGWDICSCQGRWNTGQDRNLGKMKRELVKLEGISNYSAQSGYLNKRPLPNYWSLAKLNIYLLYFGEFPLKHTTRYLTQCSVMSRKCNPKWWLFEICYPCLISH